MKLIDILVEENIENGWSWPEHANCITQDSDREIIPATCQPCVAKFDASFNRWFLNGSRIGGFIADILASDYETAIITREQYEAALAAKNEGWIEWGGGEFPPVSTNTIVDVKFKKGYVQSGYPAGEYSWEHNWQGPNIIAYRLHRPQEAEQAEADDEADLNECIGQASATEWNGEGLPPVGCECEAKFRHRNSAEWMYFRCVAVDCDVAFGWAGKDAVALEWESYQFRHIRSEADIKRHDAAQALCYAGGGIGKVDESAGIGSCWFDVYDAIAAGKIPGVKLED
nr:MAG TPA: hypothetical protein [Caudoviricetes sp.]